MTVAQDVTRREAIAEYQILDQPPEPDLLGLVQLAATVCGVPTAVINIIDDRSQHQIAAIGMQASTCSREDSMCAAVLQNPGLVVVPDARDDDRFAANPFVTGVIGNVRFYASSPLITPQGVSIGTICIFDEQTGDLTPERRDSLNLIAHQVIDVLELRRIATELNRSNEQLERFAAQVSHDLKNPLMAVSGFIELAADSPEMADAPQATESLARAESAATRMGTMIGDLLDYARAGGARPRQDDVDVQHIVRAVVDDLSTAIAASGARIEVDAAIRLTGDATLLRALVQNLVANAIKFTSAAGVEPYIVIVAETLVGGWRLSVDDNGPGVAPEDRERVFDLMDRGSSDDVPGLGIGLSTCQRIVEAHGGSIGIGESALGGASVWVVLPRPGIASRPTDAVTPEASRPDSV
ncbi:histidine kinase [Leifsonia sp. ALI-44-B]|jgi:signal transduction histidine kinase|uniref:sensor histidine kinase n=1 Tax=Leifsonia sp. ALI-44-B TaxID=1933776 RepID=UPI00097CBA3C|nr:ATP-binding protein [Leifsonia sp. ALI-44-B]ONI64257.1 histidine kinase [Leifsonia sp. ALI-44-B]